MKYKLIILFVIICFLYMYYFQNVKIIEHGKESEFDNYQMTKFTSKLRNWYPLKNDNFTIDFGNNYFSFFNSIGNFGFHSVYVNNDEIVGSICCRFVRNSWYICDLKILPEFRGRKITYKLFVKKFISCYLKSNRGYAVSMYPNPSVAKLNDGFAILRFKNLGYIHIFLVDYPTIMKIHEIFKIHFGYKYIGFLDTNESKRLILKDSTVLKTLHLYTSDKYKSFIPIEKITNDFQYFFCLHDRDLFLLKPFNIQEFGKATLYAYNMDIDDFNDLSTAEI